MKNNPFDTPDFKKAHMNMCIEGWYYQFIGEDYAKPFEEVYYLCSNVEEVERYITAYEDKYGTKLKYRIDDAFCFISQVK
jgi:hypothetical protein